MAASGTTLSTDMQFTCEESYQYPAVTLLIGTLGIIGASYFVIRIVGKYLGAFGGCKLKLITIKMSQQPIERKRGNRL